MMTSINELVGSADFQVICGTLALTFLSVWMLVRKPLGLPPGPRWRTPILGNMRDFCQKDMRVMTNQFRERYGDIYNVYIGRRLVIVISGADLIHEAFVATQDISHSNAIMFVPMTRTSGYGLKPLSRRRWNTLRTFTASTLRYICLEHRLLETKVHEDVPQLIASFRTKRNQKYNADTNKGNEEDDVDTITTNQDGAVDTSKALLSIVSSVTASLTLGMNRGPQDPAFKRMVNLLQKMHNVGGVAGILSFLPMMRYIPGDFFQIKESEAVNADMTALIDELIADCKENYDEENIRDFTTAFLVQMKQLDDGSREKKYFQEFDLRLILGDIFGASVQVMTAWLQSTVSYLVLYPDMQQKIFGEISNNVGSRRLPNISDSPNLPFTEAFIMESQRLTDHVIFADKYGVPCDVTFRGYKIPHDAIVLPDITSVSMDPKIWDNPSLFRPDRFLTKDGQFRNPVAFDTLFTGRRYCLGDDIARMEVLLVVSALVQSLQLRADDSSESQTPPRIVGVSRN